jgi:hypothetical protein
MILNVEITNKLGINLTSDVSRIKHTGNEELNISSKSKINIITENKDEVDPNNIDINTGDGLGDINLQAGSGIIQGGNINLIAGDSNVDNETGNWYAGGIDILGGASYGYGAYEVE